MSKVLFSGGNWDFTLREAIAVPTIIGILLIIGFVISNKIDNGIQERNFIYHSAPHVETVDDFKDRVATDKRNVFASGHLSTVYPVRFSDIYTRLLTSPAIYDLPEGEYLYAEIEREHYTKHTRTVRDSNGKSRKETYYSWDHRETKSRQSEYVFFCNVLLPTSKFDFKMSKENLGRVTHGDDRWNFAAYNTDYDGIIFTMISDGTISDNTPFYIGYDNIDDLEKRLTTSHAVGIFWIFWSLLIIAAAIVFIVIDNRWLE